jgi:hypothetical protein
MQFPKFFPLVPALGALCLLGTTSTGLSDHHHGGGGCHFDSHHHFSHGGYYGGPYFYGGYPSYYGGYPYYYGPSLSFTFSHSSGPGHYYGDDSGNLAVDVQRELRRRGYYHGAIDGDVGPGTRAAIRTYQYDHRLVASSRIDRELLYSLGIR